MVRLGSKATCALVLISTLGFGCSMPAEGEAEPSQWSSPIENGERPSGNRGSVQLEVRSPGGSTSWCSGQVVSQDTLLTAAHCFYDAGWYVDGWSSSITVPIAVKRQNSDGSWSSISGSGNTTLANASVWVSETYVDYADAGSDYRRGNDVAVVRFPIAFRNITRFEATAIATSMAQSSEWLWVHGYGYIDDNTFPGELYVGLVEDLSWNRSSSTSEYKTIESNYGASDPHLCKADSGGPWKMQTAGPAPFHAIQFGVTSSGLGDGNCKEDRAYAAMLAYHDTWMDDIIVAGRGSCTNDSYLVFPHQDDWETVSINVLVCW